MSAVSRNATRLNIVVPTDKLGDLLVAIGIVLGGTVGADKHPLRKGVARGLGHKKTTRRGKRGSTRNPVPAAIPPSQRSEGAAVQLLDDHYKQFRRWTAVDAKNAPAKTVSRTDAPVVPPKKGRGQIPTPCDGGPVSVVAQHESAPLTRVVRERSIPQDPKGFVPTGNTATTTLPNRVGKKPVWKPTKETAGIAGPLLSGDAPTLSAATKTPRSDKPSNVVTKVRGDAPLSAASKTSTRPLSLRMELEKELASFTQCKLGNDGNMRDIIPIKLDRKHCDPDNTPSYYLGEINELANTVYHELKYIREHQESCTDKKGRTAARC